MSTVKQWRFLVSVLCTAITASTADAQTPPPKPGDVMIEKYLAQESTKLSQNFLDGAKSLEEWQARRPRLKQEFLDMLGLWPLPEKTPLQAKVTGTLERDNFVVEKLHFQSRPGLYVTGNLYRPQQIKGKLPTVLLLVGHYNRGRNGHKTFMQDHGMWFANNGYVCLIIDTLTRGEIPGEHQGTYREGRWWWQARGYTPAGVECWNGIRAIDYLVSRSDVDADRLAVTGLSGGGAGTFWIAAADDRIKCAVPASGMTDWESNINNKLCIMHCDCMYPLNTYGWEFTTVAALIAPRPMLFVNCDDDLGFPMAANRRIASRLHQIYQFYGKPELFDAFVCQGPPGAHAYTSDSRIAIFQWLNRHLEHDTQPLKDVSFALLPEEQLRTFPEDKDLPLDAINSRIDESFVAAGRVKLPDATDFESWQRNLLDELRAKSFRTFPDRIPIPDKTPTPGIYTFKEWLKEDLRQTRTTEIGIQVFLDFKRIADQQLPRNDVTTLIVLNADEELNGIPEWAAKLTTGEDAMVALAPRGAGPTTWTHRSPPNFVERAHAMLGRTVDQGRVWDIAATAHWLEGKKGVKVIGRGQAGILAAYAALFEPAIREVVILDPTVSHRDGPIFLNVLRVLDIPDALGLLAPRPLTLINAHDRAFDRTAEIYQLGGAASQFQRP